ncbi:hypothetical protein BaRGS_00019545 [Batillaria attramentaria]|uniref:Uncharacterized protein n=1 Tax=Batillaria attramentaria TaxID=370345 RepID=A0ABD0KPP9_9CAEN
MSPRMDVIDALISFTVCCTHPERNMQETTLGWGLSVVGQVCLLPPLVLCPTAPAVWRAWRQPGTLDNLLKEGSAVELLNVISQSSRRVIECSRPQQAHNSLVAGKFVCQNSRKLLCILCCKLVCDVAVPSNNGPSCNQDSTSTQKP